MRATTWYYALGADLTPVRISIPIAENALSGKGMGDVPSECRYDEESLLIVGVVLIIEKRQPRAIERIGVQRVTADDVEVVRPENVPAEIFENLGDEMSRRFSSDSHPSELADFLARVLGFLPIDVSTTMGQRVSEVHKSYARLVRNGVAKHEIWDLATGKCLPAETALGR